MKVAAINDLSGFGKCSLLADISVLSALGVEVCPVPTAVLTAQTGFSSYYMHDTGDMVTHSKEEWEKMGESFDGILTGYFPSEKQADDVMDFVRAFNKENTVLMVDPVMGDGGRCYSNYSEGMLQKIKELTSEADIITPNLTELCLLAGEDAGRVIDEIKTDKNLNKVVEIAEKVRTNDKQKIVVTGISIGKDDLCNLVVYSGGASEIQCKTNGQSYSGTGDLFAASLMGNVLKGKNIIEAVNATVDFISDAIAATPSGDRNYGVNFEKVLNK